MKKMILFPLVALMAAAFACNRENSAQSKTQVDSVKTNVSSQTGPLAKSSGKKGTLLFFMNPDGIPCQMQNEILNEALSEIKEIVDVQYIKTTNPSDKDYFYDFSIRGLPSMLVIDAEKKIIARFTPGIQNRETIVKAIKGL